MGERLEQSNEKAAAQIIREYFRNEGLELLDSADDTDFGILSPSGDTLIHHNALAVIQGYDRKLKDSYIVIGTPFSSDPSGALALMSLAKMLKTNSVLLRRSIVFAAFGAGAKMQNAGSWYFLNRSFKTSAAKIDAMVELYLLGQGSAGFGAYTASCAGLDKTLGELGSSLQPLHPAKLSEEPTPTDHRSFIASQIPSIQFISGSVPYVELSTKEINFEYLERETEYIYNYVMALANADAAPTFEQESSAPKQIEAVSWNDCDYKPAFMNNTNPSVFLERWVYVYLKYPQYAIDKGIQGKVLVEFIIDERGKVRDVQVLRGVHSSLDEEAVKVIESSPDWRPARVRGKKVPCKMSLYVEFRLIKK